MNKFEFLQKKSFLIVLLLCLLLVFITAASFKYSKPKTINNNNKPQQEYVRELTDDDSTEQDNNSIRQENDTNSSEEIQNKKEVDSDDTSDKKQDISELKTINTDDNDNDLSPYDKAEQLLEEEKYESAVYEYQQIANNSSDSYEAADCYQKIATIYGYMKRYGTALSFAQKAYNNAPSNEREFLLAKLYFKTGSVEKAYEHVNNIFKRDFSIDK